MPSENMCNACPNTEYKTLKKKTNRKKRETNADEICKEKGEGTWADPEDCTKYFTCRNLNVAWGEKKKEVCYLGSYFDRTLNQCKWVGEGNYNCDEILGKPSNEVEVKTTNDTTKSKNRQRIFFEKDGVVNKEIEETIIPASSYTCPADSSDSSEFVKCFTCESDARSIPKCKNAPGGSSTVTRCNSKNKKCFSKSVYDSRDVLVSFQRGCASLAELEGNLLEANSNEPRSTSNCVRNPNGTKSCYVYCTSSLCNTVTDIRATNNALTTTNSKCLFIVNFVFVAITSFFYI